MRRPAPIGWPLLPQPDAQGQLHYAPSLNDSVRASMRVILSTRPGELLFHPDFGAGLEEFLDQPDSLSLRREIHDRVQESLARWEPRVAVDRVNVDASTEQPSRLRIEIAYRLVRTGENFSLGLNLTSGVS